MRQYYKYLILIIVLFVNIVVSAKDKDSTKTKKKDTLIVSYFHKGSLDTSLIPNTIKLNNSLDGVQIYNPLQQVCYFPVILSNEGQAYKSLVFAPNFNMGFDLGLHSFDGYFTNFNNVKYYKVRTPFTEASTSLGANSEEYLDVRHYQNINRLINIGFDYQIMSSLGQYTWQKSYITNFDVTASYFSKNKKYSVLGCFILNRLRADENGGITNTNFTNILVNSTNLTNDKTRIRETGFEVKQYYVLDKNQEPRTKGDIKTDSIEKRQEYKTFNLGVISYDFKWDREFQAYQDSVPHNDFYPAPFYDTKQTLDSIMLYRITNAFGWHPYINSKKTHERIIDFYFNIKSEILLYYNKYCTTGQFYEVLPSAGFSTNQFKRFSFNFNTEYVNGYPNNGDYKLNGSIAIKTGNAKDTLNKLVLKGSYLNQSPGYTYDFYVSNYFFWWDNDFNKTTTKYAGIEYLFKNFNAGVDYYQLGNYLYFNEEEVPAQANRNITLLEPYIYNKLRVRNFELINKIVYQNLNHNDVIRLPRYVIYESLFYNFSLFKKNLIMQVGTDFWYTNKYYADAYIPALTQFCIQNTTEIVENISFDPFINVRVKRAKLFVKYQHINYSFTKIKTYQAPYYPLPDAAIKFGVLWRFYD